MIKLKSIIYRYTKIYLAEKEELAYIQSEEAKRKIEKMMSANREIEVSQDTLAELDISGLSEENARSIAIGLWQAKHGFTTPFFMFRKMEKITGRKLARVIYRILLPFYSLKYDLRLLRSKMKKAIFNK